MKFGLIFYDTAVPEWASAYFNYKLLKKLLSPHKLMQKLYIRTVIKEGREEITISTARDSDMTELREFSILFD
jgi:hypothetical protein